MGKTQKRGQFQPWMGWVSWVCVSFFTPFDAGFALPPGDDVPEEVLRSHFWIEEQAESEGVPRTVILQRSAQDGQALTLSDVVTQQQQAQFPPQPERQLAPELKELITLLRVRKVFRSLLPF